MLKSKKKSAPTAATVQSAKFFRQSQDTINSEETQALDDRGAKLLLAFRKLSKEDKKDIIGLLNFMLEKQRKDERADSALEEWRSMTFYQKRRYIEEGLS